MTGHILSLKYINGLDPSAAGPCSPPHVVGSLFDPPPSRLPSPLLPVRPIPGKCRNKEDDPEFQPAAVMLADGRSAHRLGPSLIILLSVVYTTHPIPRRGRNSTIAALAHESDFLFVSSSVIHVHPACWKTLIISQIIINFLLKELNIYFGWTSGVAQIGAVATVF